jgi:hypothetical protein
VPVPTFSKKLDLPPVILTNEPLTVGTGTRLLFNVTD